MTENTRVDSHESIESNDDSLLQTYTQVASFAGDEQSAEQHRLSLRDKLEREKIERRKARGNSLLGMIRNLFRAH